MTQYSIRPKRSAIRTQAVYLHSTMPGVTCLRLSDVSVICRVTYLQFQTQSDFHQYIARQAAPSLQRTIGFNMQQATIALCMIVAWAAGPSARCKPRPRPSARLSAVSHIPGQTNSPA